jgi:fatty acid desaturase
MTKPDRVALISVAAVVVVAAILQSSNAFTALVVSVLILPLARLLVRHAAHPWRTALFGTSIAPWTMVLHDAFARFLLIPQNASIDTARDEHMQASAFVLFWIPFLAAAAGILALLISSGDDGDGDGSPSKLYALIMFGLLVLSLAGANYRFTM